MARNNFIPTSEFSKMVLNRFVFLAACLLFTATLVISPFSDRGANARSTEPTTGMPPGTVLVQDVAKNKIVIGMLSSFSTDPNPGSATMHPGDTVNGGKTTVLNGTGDKDTSMYVVNSGRKAQLGTTTAGSSQEAVIDRYFTLPADNINMLDAPATSASVSNYVSGNIVRVKYASTKANKTAIIRLEVGKASGIKPFVVYPCDKSPKNNTALYSHTNKVRSTMMFVATGAGAEVCIKGGSNAAKLTVETYGYANWTLEAPKSLLSMISENKRAAAGSVVTVDTGLPNQIALLQVTATSGSKGAVEVYTTQKGSKKMNVLYTDGNSRDVVMVPVHTGSDGRVSLKGTVQAGYNVVLMGGLDYRESGVKLANYVAPKQLEDTRNGYPGQGLLRLSSKGDYIKPYEISGIRCTYVDLTPEYRVKDLYLTIKGLDPDLPGSSPTENMDQGFAGINITDYQLPWPDNKYSETIYADDKGIARMDSTNTSSKYSYGVKRFTGTYEIYTYPRDYYTRDPQHTGKVLYQVDITCKPR